MEIKKEKIEKTVKGVKHIIYPKSTKLQIVKEIESGNLSVKEVMEKHEIRQAKTIQRWLKQYSQIYREQLMRITHSDGDRRQIVYKIESGKISIENAAQQCRLEPSTIKEWIKLYTCKINNVQVMAKNKKKEDPAVTSNKALEDELAYLRLKVEGLETMIDIAEKVLKIDIRKKSGTKQ